MITLPPPDFGKERAYVIAEIEARYWQMPRGLAWLLVPITMAVVFIWSIDNLKGPGPIVAAGIAAVIATVVARRLYLAIPAWNERRRSAIRLDATRAFRARVESMANDFAKAVAAVEAFEKSIAAKDYPVYVDRAMAAARCDTFTSERVRFLFNDLPEVIVSLRQSREALVHAVEADRGAVIAYEPEILDLVADFGARAAAGNVLDAYRNYQELLLRALTTLEDRRSPFDFEQILHQLSQQVQLGRDEILCEPHREAIWRDIQHKDEMLAETRRHNRAMEEAAEAAAEAARLQAEAAQQQAEAAQTAAEHLREQARAARRQAELAEERNSLLRDQVSAQQAIASNSSATAHYTGRTANSVERIAEHVTGDD